MRNLSLYITVLLLIVIQASVAEVIDIKGKINDSGNNPVENARISLKKHPEIVAYTSADGTFALQLGTPVKYRHQSLQNIILTIQNNAHNARLCLHPDKNYSSITASLHSLDGRLISKNEMFGISNRYYFEVPYSHSGICVLKINLNNTQITYPVVIHNNSVSITGTSRVSRNAPAMYTAMSLDADDTLIVYKKGFKTHYTSVSYTPPDDIGIELTNSKPWIPENRSSLTFEGGMVKIPAKGYDFEMGQPNDTIWGRIDGLPTSETEQPVHTVTFTHDFWIDTSEVCQGEFDSLMKQYPKYSSSFETTHGQGKNYPVYAVTWDDAVLFCNARSKRDGFDTVYTYSKITGSPGSKCELLNVKSNLAANGYHLPTEAQWEYACRGGTVTDFYWGKNLDDYSSEVPADEISTFEVWVNNSFSKGLGSPSFGTHPVASKEANAYGLYDMAGNVSEWCHDYMSSYTCDKATDPSGPEQPNEEDGAFHVSRGGNWGNDVTFLRSTNRRFDPPDYFYFFLGFRCARTIQ
jgi:formylglycine-generating enzyme required for sulfatase activity